MTDDEFLQRMEELDESVERDLKKMERTSRWILASAMMLIVLTIIVQVVR